MRGFSVTDAFPDARNNYHGFRVDPFQPRRVWFTSRFVGTNTGKFGGSVPPSGRLVEPPPQACSLTFDPATGLCTRLTVGYSQDRSVGNTGGLGGVFGLLFAIGAPLPFPEAQPWRMSLRYRLFNVLGGAAQKLGKLLSRGE